MRREAEVGVWDGKRGKQSYSLKHDSPEGSAHCSVRRSRDGMTTYKDSSVLGIEIDMCIIQDTYPQVYMYIYIRRHIGEQGGWEVGW